RPMVKALPHVYCNTRTKPDTWVRVRLRTGVSTPGVGASDIAIAILLHALAHPRAKKGDDRDTDPVSLSITYARSRYGVTTKLTGSIVGLATGIGTTMPTSWLAPTGSAAVCSGDRLTSYKPSATYSAVPETATSPAALTTRNDTSEMRSEAYGSPSNVTHKSKRAVWPWRTRAGPSTSRSAYMGSAKMSHRSARSG